jgi:rhodanese-related sulfurtransferase
MSVENDPAPALQAYAHPDKLVTTEWLAAHLDTPGLVVVESDEDVLLYESGHIPGAVKVDWHLELNDHLTRDYLDPAAFAALCEAKGIGRDDTIVFYGDNFNWWAAYALWVFSLFGHRDVRLLDGGRQKWAAEGRELTRERTQRPAASYPVPIREDGPLRAFRDQVMAHISSGRPLVDVRSPQEYTGCGQQAVEGGGERRRHVQAGRRARQDLPGRAGAGDRRRRDRVLPDRRTVQPHLVRAAPPARLPAGAQLRRLLDGVGQSRARPHREGKRARRPVLITAGPPRRRR